MIKALANRYNQTFFGMWLLVFLVAMAVLELSPFTVVLMDKSRLLDFGGTLRHAVAEAIYNALAFSQLLQARWVAFVAASTPSFLTLWHLVIATNIAVLVALPALLLRWVALYFKTQSEVQALQADRDFLRKRK